jgi:hypothetical protein
MNVSSPSVSPEEIEGLRAVLEAARCYWHGRASDQATAALHDAQRLMGRLLEMANHNAPILAPLLADPSAQEGPIFTLVESAQRVAGEYTKAHDPWWPDTLSMSPDRISTLGDEQVQTLQVCLRKLGLTLKFDGALPAAAMQASRENLGPWPENED